jgi:hypothetical protein
MDPKAFQFIMQQGRFNGANISRNTLLRAYPHMGNLTGVRPDLGYEGQQGKVVYNDFQVQLERRYSRGLTTSFMYTYAKSRDSWYANEFDDMWTWRVNNDARPHRVVWTGIYELPFGKGRQFVTENPIQHIIGGWNLGWIGQYQTGQALSFGNRFFFGDLSQLSELAKHEEVWDNDIHQWFNPGMSWNPGVIQPGLARSTPRPSDFVGFEGRSDQQPGYNVRTLPDRFGNLRGDAIRKWDFKITRQFRMTESTRTEFSVDLLNAMNTTMFANPNTDPTNTNFGRVTSQNGPSRIIQLNVRILF